MTETNWTPESGLRAEYPHIPWDDPVVVTVNDRSAHVCRCCVALHGLKGIDVLNGTAGYNSEQECRAHIAGSHQ
jgi:hypothetical protein